MYLQHKIMKTVLLKAIRNNIKLNIYSLFCLGSSPHAAIGKEYSFS